MITTLTRRYWAVDRCPDQPLQRVPGERCPGVEGGAGWNWSQKQRSSLLEPRQPGLAVTPWRSSTREGGEADLSKRLSRGRHLYGASVDHQCE